MEQVCLRVEIVIPLAAGVRSGNAHTAGRWRRILSGLGHAVSVSEGDGGFDGDLLVVLHAVKSRGALTTYRKRVPGGKVVLCLTGTDIYGEHGPEFRASIEEADRIVVLQSKALDRIPEDLRAKARVIVQGVEASGEQEVPSEAEGFQVCVVGHLREVKDPLRAAEAARLLPADSAIRVVQAGAILEEEFRGRVEREMEINPRYRWVGELPAEETRALIASSKAMVLSSRSEGGARVVGEAAVEGTPVLSSRIEGVLGMLGEDYGGYFTYGATEELRDLLLRFERDTAFREALRAEIAERADRFDPRREEEAWRRLLREIEVL